MDACESSVENYRFEGGKITIQLIDNQKFYQAGQVVQGQVNLHLTEPCYEAENLNIGLY